MRTTEAHAQFCEDFIKAMNSRDNEGSSAEATPEIAGPAKVVAAVATGSLWVDACEIMKLVRRYEREVELCNASADEAHKLKLAVACAADGARANAFAQASFDLRLLVGGASLRQPTENTK